MELAEKQPPNRASASARIVPLLRAVIVPVMAVVVALLIGAVIIAISGANPIKAYTSLVSGGLGNAKAIERTFEKATPLIFGGLAVALAFRAGLFNIGAQGQLLFGALMAGYAGFAIEGLPMVIHLPLALLFGAVTGALWAAIAGVLRAYTGAHEVITTIMLNFVAINITDYLSNGPWKASGVVARTPKILETAEMGKIGNVPLGLVLALVVALVVWWLIDRTTIGFELRTVGHNPNASQYAGISVRRMTILAMVLSGLLAGLGGAVETLGVVHRFQPGFNAGLGFTAITIALLARNHPLGVIPAALLIGVMQAGSSRMQLDSGVASDIIEVVQALILFFVAADVLIRTLLRMRDTGDNITLSSGWGQS